MATCRKYPEEEVQEELVALRSILGEEKFHAGGSGERGTMLVALEKAGGGPFLVRNAVSGSTVEVATLGDLEVRFKMREDYPEREMPEFSLDCFWMTSEQLGRLAELLKSEWTEGEVVLYHWYQLLRDRALETLEIEDRLTVESGQVLRELVRLDAKAKGTRFSECLICFSELSCQDFEVAGEKGCNHFYCRRCLAVYCRTQIEDEGNQAGVKCPDPACDSVLDHGVVRRLVGTRLFEHYDRGMLHRAIRSMSSTTWCPRVDCQHPAQVREAERCGQCPACGFVFCTQCERTFHGPTRCDSHQLHLLEAAREEDGAGGEAAPSKDLDELEGMLRSVGLAKAKEHVDRVVGEMLSSLTHGERERLATQYLEVTKQCQDVLCI